MGMIKNRFIDALVKLILLSAIIHLSLLLVYSILNLDFIYLNFFNLLDFDLFFPEVINGVLSQLLSIIVVIIVYVVIYIYFTDRDK